MSAERGASPEKRSEGTKFEDLYRKAWGAVNPKQAHYLAERAFVEIGHAGNMTAAMEAIPTLAEEYKELQPYLGRKLDQLKKLEEVANEPEGLSSESNPVIEVGTSGMYWSQEVLGLKPIIGKRESEFGATFARVIGKLEAIRRKIAIKIMEWPETRDATTNKKYCDDLQTVDWVLANLIETIRYNKDLTTSDAMIHKLCDPTLLEVVKRHAPELYPKDGSAEQLAKSLSS